MRQTRFRFQLAQFIPRQTLRHESHRHLIGVETERLGQCLIERLRGARQALSPTPAPRFLSQAEKTSGAQDVDDLVRRQGAPVREEHRPGTAPGKGRCRSDAQSGCSSVHGATSCAPSTTCGTRRKDAVAGKNDFPPLFSHTT